MSQVTIDLGVYAKNIKEALNQQPIDRAAVNCYLEIINDMQKNSFLSADAVIGDKIFIQNIINMVMEDVALDQEKKRAFLQIVASYTKHHDIMRELFLDSVKKAVDVFDEHKKKLSNITAESKISELDVTLSDAEDMTIKEYYKQYIKQFPERKSMYEAFLSKLPDALNKQIPERTVTDEQAKDFARFLYNDQIANQLVEGIKDESKKISQGLNESVPQSLATQQKILHHYKAEAEKVAIKAVTLCVLEHRLNDVKISADEIKKIDDLKIRLEKIKTTDANFVDTVMNISKAIMDIVSSLYVKIFGNEVQKMLQDYQTEISKEIRTEIYKDVTKLASGAMDVVKEVVGDLNLRMPRPSINIGFSL
jgi:hypothetical protein